MIMEPRFITQWNYDPSMYQGEVNDSPSETIEGQSLTVTEVLLKFSRGTLPQIQFPTYYDGEDPDYDEYDPTLSPDFDLSDTDGNLERIQELTSRSDKHQTKAAEPPAPSAATPEETETDPSPEGA